MTGVGEDVEKSESLYSAGESDAVALENGLAVL